MGVVEECVERKLSEHGTKGEKPSDQDLAIKFAECRDDHPGGIDGASEADRCPPGQHWCEEEQECMPGESMGRENALMGYKFAGSMDENDDINGQIAQSMHEQQFGQNLVDEDEDAVIEMVNASKTWTKENKSTVLGMAYNYHNKIFGEEDEDELQHGNSFSNDVSQEMYKTTLEIVRDWPHKTLTNEFLISQLTARGHDPMAATEFVLNSLEVNLYPNVASIPQTEDEDLEVPNQNARTDFKPEDIMMGGVDRDVLDADTITKDPKPNLGPMFKEDPNKETNQERTEINIKNKKRSSNERIHHVANSTMSKSPEAEDMGGMTQSLDQTIGPPDTMMTPEPEVPGPCDPGKTLNPVTGVCEEVSLAQVESPDLGVTAGIPAGTEHYSKKN